MSSTITTTATITTDEIFRQSFKILNSNPFHFLTTSLLFIPFTMLISNPTAIFTIISTSVSENLLTLKTLTTLLAVILPAVAGTSLITYSTHQSIRRTPLTFISAFKSLSHSFIPLVSTLIVYIIYQIIILSSFIEAINSLTAIALVICLELLFIVIWGYAAAVSVLESKFGFVPLLQSIKQLFQFVSVSFSILILSGFAIFSSLCVCPTEYEKGMTSMWLSVLHLVTSYILASFGILFYIVANTLLYVQCKVARGEEIAEVTVAKEVSREDQDGRTEGFTIMMNLFVYVRMFVLCVANYKQLI